MVIDPPNLQRSACEGDGLTCLQMDESATPGGGDDDGKKWTNKIQWDKKSGFEYIEFNVNASHCAMHFERPGTDPKLHKD